MTAPGRRHEFARELERLSRPLYPKTTQDVGFATCDDPDCAAVHIGALSPDCHPDSPVRAVWRPVEECLVLLCSTCLGQVLAVRVASGPV